MNVIVSNKQKNVIDNANIDAIKDLNGLFNIDDLLNKFKNYFFSKMILDATSVVDFANDAVLEKLARGIGSERLIILLPENPAPPKEFLSKLDNLGIYNYSTNIEDVVNFISNPRTINNITNNTLDISDNFYVDNSIKANDNYNENDSNSENYVEPLSNDNNYNIYELNEHNYELNNHNYELNNQSHEVNNQNLGNNNFINTNNQVNDMSYVSTNKKVIGIKNVTLHAGSTTLVYMLTKIVSNNYNKRVLALEVNKDDFKFYQDKNMISISENQVNSNVINSNAEIIFVDLNNCINSSFCNDVLYLVEPSVIMLNRLMMENRFAFRELRDKKIVLNKSLLTSKDVIALSNEAGVKMFYNLPPLNDRIDNNVLIKMLEELDVI